MNVKPEAIDARKNTLHVDEDETGERVLDSLMRVENFLVAAIDSVDEKMGEGYAKAHPELLGALVQTATLDFHARDLVTTIGTLIDEVERLGMNVGPIAGPIQRADDKQREGTQP